MKTGIPNRCVYEQVSWTPLWTHERAQATAGTFLYTCPYICTRIQESTIDRRKP